MEQKKEVETLDSLVNSITKDVYVKSFSIDLCGTVDDTSHRIIYTRYKNSGVLKVIDSTFPVNYRLANVEYYQVTGTKLVIKDTKSFDNDVYGFLNECCNTQIYPRAICDGVLYIIRIKLSNGKKYNFDVELEGVYTITGQFYEFLTNYQDKFYMDT